MKKVLLICCVLFASCNDDDENKNECIDQEKWGIIDACPQHIDPVCGCDNVNYNNDCFAKAAGVVTWTKGTCP